MKKHVNIPVFIPHYGCPNDCVFCNQRKITGKPCYDKNAVINEIEAALSTVDVSCTEVELAFFGGSFTAIPREEMLGLLEVSDLFISRGAISSVRLSTRPDAITPEILGILKAHGVKTVELGLQSFSDTVLSACRRGHTSAQSEIACALIKEYGFDLVGQMMVGLPCSTVEDEIMTARRICELGCDGARIYPTVVFPDTALMDMKNSGQYTPLTTEQAVLRTAEVIKVFALSDVKIIRIGLCANETLRDADFADNYHPAIGELALSRYFRDRMESLLSSLTADISGKEAVFTVARGRISQAVGQKRGNILYLKERFSLGSIKVREDFNLSAFSLSLDIN